VRKSPVFVMILHAVENGVGLNFELAELINKWLRHQCERCFEYVQKIVERTGTCILVNKAMEEHINMVVVAVGDGLLPSRKDSHDFPVLGRVLGPGRPVLPIEFRKFEPGQCAYELLA